MTTLFSAPGANCGDRVLWALRYKGVAHELVDADLPDGAARLARLSPFGRVPVLVVEGQAPLSESMAICEYLEEAHPTPPLLGEDRALRARVREVCEAINASIHPIQNRSVVQQFQPAWSAEQIRAFRSQ